MYSEPMVQFVIQPQWSLLLLLSKSVDQTICFRQWHTVSCDASAWAWNCATVNFLRAIVFLLQSVNQSS